MNKQPRYIEFARDGSIFTYIDRAMTELHSFDGEPALISGDGECIAYYKEGKLHRHYGPAVIVCNDRSGASDQYWVEGVNCTLDEEEGSTMMPDADEEYYDAVFAEFEESIKDLMRVVLEGASRKLA